MPKTSSCIYNINYHFVWCPKYRKPILIGKIKNFMEEQIHTISETKGYKVLELKIMPDHIHLFISAPPIESPTAIIKILKGVSGLRLFRAYPELKKDYWDGHIWSPSYYVGTAGMVSFKTIQDYINRVEHDDRRSKRRNSSTHQR
jgi:putative transposase